MTSADKNLFQEVQYLTIAPDYQGQRVDNFLLTYLKSVPKSFVYRILRKGEVRVNKKRVKPTYRLNGGDILRIPPMRIAARIHDKVAVNAHTLQRINELCGRIIYQNDDFMVLNKPAGLAVHGGTGLAYGLIELLKADYSLTDVPAAESFFAQRQQLELVHRLDQGTSGCLMVAKSRGGLNQLQSMLKSRTINKQYICLLSGVLAKDQLTVQLPLLEDKEISGEKMVVVDEQGKASHSEFIVQQRFHDATLAKVNLITGRKHQIRVHSRYLGHAIVGDSKYGDKSVNAEFKQLGLSGLFLHAQTLQMTIDGQALCIESPLPENFDKLQSKLL